MAAGGIHPESPKDFLGQAFIQREPDEQMFAPKVAVAEG
jgi:hypothetical protein